MSDCLFCKVASGQIPAKVVHQDGDIVAFEDINPQAPGHVLVVPRKHVAALNRGQADARALDWGGTQHPGSEAEGDHGPGEWSLH